MAGTWKFQNKRRPGAYINVKGNGQSGNDSAVGRLLMINNAPFNWGKNGVIELTSESNFKAKLGTDLNDENLLPLKEALKNAETVLFVNTNEGTPAKGNDNKSPWTFEAKYPGLRGNDITINIIPTPEGKVIVQTLLDSSLVDEQSFKADTKFESFKNDYVVATASPTTEAKVDNTTIKLEGGTSENNVKYIDAYINPDLMNDALETEHYSVVTYNQPIHDPNTNSYSLLVEAVKRIRENNGVYVRAVVPYLEDDHEQGGYNYEGVSVVYNGFIEDNGREIIPEVATAYFAGLSASAGPDTSLTYTDVADASEALPKLNNDKTIDALNSGLIVFTTKPGQRVVVEQDINTLTKFTQNRPKEFSKNRIIRTLDEICTNSQETFENSFLGKVSNNANGRDLFKANRISYLTDLQNRNIIQNFSPNDVEVLPGNDSDSIVVNLAITPVDSMEKLYMTVLVN